MDAKLVIAVSLAVMAAAPVGAKTLETLLVPRPVPPDHVGDDKGWTAH